MDHRWTIEWRRVGPALMMAAVLAGVVLSGRGGSVAAQQETAARTPVQSVWPLPPDDPRIRYVGVYATGEDVEGKKSKTRMQWFKEMLMGRLRESELERDKGLAKPFGIAVDSRNRIIVADTELAAVLVLDIDGKIFTGIGETGREVAFRIPIGVAVDAQDNIYVGDNGHGRVMVFGPDLRYRGTIGQAGDMIAPTGLAIDDAEQRLVVVDSRADRLMTYDLSTNLLIHQVGTRGTGDGEFFFPTGVAVGPDSTIYVSDTMNYRVQVFDKDLNFIRSFGSLGINAGQFRRPKGIAVDAENLVYVIDSDFNNFQIFTSEGMPVLAVGEFGARPGQMSLPAGIFVQRTTHRIYVAEQINRRVQIFERIGS